MSYWNGWLKTHIKVPPKSKKVNVKFHKSIKLKTNRTLTFGGKADRTETTRATTLFIYAMKYTILD